MTGKGTLCCDCCESKSKYFSVFPYGTIISLKSVASFFFETIRLVSDREHESNLNRISSLSYLFTLFPYLDTVLRFVNLFLISHNVFLFRKL